MEDQLGCGDIVEVLTPGGAEKVVRAAAQAILTRHLRPPADLAAQHQTAARELSHHRLLAYHRWHPPGQPHLRPELTPEWNTLIETPPAPHLPVEDPKEPFWPGINVNLRHAELTLADFSGCQVAAADFSDARFVGSASFDWAGFGHADFTGAEFRDQVSFIGTMFRDGAHFRGLTAASTATFDGATFAASTYLDFNHPDELPPPWLEDDREGLAIDQRRRPHRSTRQLSFA